MGTVGVSGVTLGMYDGQKIPKDLKELNEEYLSLSPITRTLSDKRLEEAERTIAQSQGVESAKLGDDYIIIGRGAVRKGLLDRYASLGRRRTLDTLLVVLNSLVLLNLFHWRK